MGFAPTVELYPFRVTHHPEPHHNYIYPGQKETGVQVGMVE
jgi:hypothetical protein